MEIRYRSKFRQGYKRLPRNIQEKVEKLENIFRKNPFDTKLKTHKLHGPLSDFYAFSIDYNYRVIFSFAEKKVVEFYLIGKHDIYE